MKIANWTKTVDRNVSDVDHLMSAPIAEWEHDETGDVVRVMRFDDPDENLWYGVEANGEVDFGSSSCKKAHDAAVDLLRHVADGGELA